MPVFTIHETHSFSIIFFLRECSVNSFTNVVTFPCSNVLLTFHALDIDLDMRILLRNLFFFHFFAQPKQNKKESITRRFSRFKTSADDLTVYINIIGIQISIKCIFLRLDYCYINNEMTSVVIYQLELYLFEYIYITC